MKEKQWVQHISGQGEKWEVHQETDRSFLIWKGLPMDGAVTYRLPKSEYRLCKPPEVWVDCIKTVGIALPEQALKDLQCNGLTLAVLPHGYKWRWTPSSFLTIEKLVKQ